MLRFLGRLAVLRCLQGRGRVHFRYPMSLMILVPALARGRRRSPALARVAVLATRWYV